MNKLFIFLTISLSMFPLFSQEGFPVFQDYLSDNVYLIHPAAAGIGETGKVRAAIRMEGIGVANAPQIQTLSFHGKLGKEGSKAAFGLVLLNNASNDFFTQKAIQGTYAYHLTLNEETKFQQLSFALSMSGVQTEIGGQIFSTNSETNVTQITQPLFYVSADIGMAYNLNGLSAYLTLKNAFTNSKNDNLLNSEEIGIKNYILGLAYFFGNEKKAQFEPSIMLQYKEQINEQIIDVNFKAYKKFNNAQAWAALSYRKSLGSDFFEGATYISPIVGVNTRKMMFSYTYSKQTDAVVFTNGDFHQISIGVNVLPRALKSEANPNINGILF